MSLWTWKHDFLNVKMLEFSDFWFLLPGSAGRGGGGGDPQDGVDLVDDQVPDHPDQEISGTPDSPDSPDSLESRRFSTRPLSTLSPAELSIVKWECSLNMNRQNCSKILIGEKFLKILIRKRILLKLVSATSV